MFPLYRLQPLLSIVCRAADCYLPPPNGNDIKSLTIWVIALVASWQKANVNRTPFDIWMRPMSSGIQHAPAKVAKHCKTFIISGQIWRRKMRRPPRMKLPIVGSLGHVLKAGASTAQPHVKPPPRGSSWRVWGCGPLVGGLANRPGKMWDTSHATIHPPCVPTHISRLSQYLGFSIRK